MTSLMDNEGFTISDKELHQKAKAEGDVLTDTSSSQSDPTYAPGISTKKRKSKKG